MKLKKIKDIGTKVTEINDTRINDAGIGQFFEDFIADTASLTEDICQSGFDTVHDQALHELKKKGEMAGWYGMAYLSELLLLLYEELSMRRHRFSGDKTAMPENNLRENILVESNLHRNGLSESNLSENGLHGNEPSAKQHNPSGHKESAPDQPASPAEIYVKLIKYLEYGKKKTAYDRGMYYYKRK